MRVPPPRLQETAWACAFVLLEERADRLTVDQRIACEVVRMVAPDRLGWPQAGAMVALFSALVARRR